MKEKEKKSRTPYTEYANQNGNRIVRFAVKASIEIIGLLLAVIIEWAAVRAIMPQGSFINIVDGSSMESTLHDRQIVFTDMSKIKRGDIVTLFFPKKVILNNPDEADKALIKRVIGVPGDKVQIKSEGIYINEKKLEEKYVSETAQYFTFIEEGFNDVTLAEDEYYVVGDNRGQSYDSRTFGVIEESDILYKQSEKPTKNFYEKLGILVGGFIVLSTLFMFIESALEELIFKLLYKRVVNKRECC